MVQDCAIHPTGFDRKPKDHENTFKQKRNRILCLSAIDFPVKCLGFDFWLISAVGLVAE